MKVFFGTSISDKQIIEFKESEISDYISEELKIEKFADGEILPLFKESIREKDVFFINSPYNHDLLMETILIIDAAKRAGCKSITLVAPFLPYSRQDKTDHLRSSIGSKALSVILESVGLSRLVTIDLHSSPIQGFYEIPVIHLNGSKFLINHIQESNIDNLCIVAPDQGAIKKCSDFCKVLPESTFAIINKKRTKPNEIHSMELVGEVSGKNVVLIDDIADTLGTLKKASELIMSNGALSVRAVTTHGILSGNAIDNLNYSQINELLVSDSISTVYEKTHKSEKLSIVSSTNFLARSIMALSLKKSVHEINSI